MVTPCARRSPTDDDGDGTANAFVLCVYQGQLWIGDFKGTDVVRIDPTRLT